MSDWLIVNADIVNEGRRFAADLRVRGGRIEAIAPSLPAQPNERVFDARGRLLVPGMIDDHVHFREPGYTAKADIGQGIELDVIAMVVLGGTSIFGGRGRIIGTLLGVLLIHETREFVSWQWNRDELNLIVLGVLVILSVLFNRFLERAER